MSHLREDVARLRGIAGAYRLAADLAVRSGGVATIEMSGADAAWCAGLLDGIADSAAALEEIETRRDRLRQVAAAAEAKGGEARLWAVVVVGAAAGFVLATVLRAVLG